MVHERPLKGSLSLEGLPSNCDDGGRRTSCCCDSGVGICICWSMAGAEVEPEPWWSLQKKWFQVSSEPWNKRRLFSIRYRYGAVANFNRNLRRLSVLIPLFKTSRYSARIGRKLKLTGSAFFFILQVLIACVSLGNRKRRIDSRLDCVKYFFSCNFQSYFAISFNIYRITWLGLTIV